MSQPFSTGTAYRIGFLFTLGALTAYGLVHALLLTRSVLVLIVVSFFLAVGLNPTAVARLWQSFQSNAPGMYWSRAWAWYILIRWSHRHGVLI